jgi:hypothetical protein
MIIIIITIPTMMGRITFTSKTRIAIIMIAAITPTITEPIVPPVLLKLSIIPNVINSGNGVWSCY